MKAAKIGIHSPARKARLFLLVGSQTLRSGKCMIREKIKLPILRDSQFLLPKIARNEKKKKIIFIPASVPEQWL
jgi:hypothetical protein